MEKDILLLASNTGDLKFMTDILSKIEIAEISERIRTECDCVQILKTINSSDFKLIFMYPREENDLCVNTYVRNLCLSNRNAILVILKKTVSLDEPQKFFSLKHCKEIWLRIDIFQNNNVFLQTLLSTLLEMPPVYISYGNTPESMETLKKISENFKKVFSHVTISFDRNELSYRQDINKYIDRLVRGEHIILLINKKYLGSKYCLGEFVRIYSNSGQYDKLKSRIYPILMDDADIYLRDPVKMKKDILFFWEQRKIEIENSLRQGHNNEEQNELNLVISILNVLPRFTEIVGLFYQLPMGTLKGESFFPIFWEIHQQMKNDGYLPLYETEGEMKKALGLGY